MIQFSCNKCGRVFQVGEDAAGRIGRCKTCGTTIVVPTAPEVAKSSLPIQPPPIPAVSTPPPLVPPPIPKLSMRLRRLNADAQQMRRAFKHFPLIQLISAIGQPPEKYVVEYRVRSLLRGPAGEPVTAERHVAEIQLTQDYPRQSPKCKMLTPMFHPNIEPAVICVGDHWTAGERLVDLVVRIGEMLAFQAYNIKSPLDGEAAMWADLNRHRLPIDGRDLRPPDFE